MIHLKRTAMPTEDIEITVHHLADTLADLIDLTLQAKLAHWNVTGPRFRAVHLQLDEVVERTRSYLDTVAERIVILGQPAEGLPSQVMHRSKVDPFPTHFVPDAEVVKLMAERLSEFAARLRGRISATQERDPVSADLLTHVLATVEEQLWMFHAQAM